MRCPKCSNVQSDDIKCKKCNTVFEVFYEKILYEKFDNAVKLFQSKNYKKAIAEFESLVNFKEHSNDSLISKSNSYILKIKKIIDENSNIENISTNNIVYINDVNSKLNKKNRIIKTVFYSSFVFLLFFSLYLHYIEEKKIHEISAAIAEATGKEISKLSILTGGVTSSLESRINRVENTIEKILPVVDNCNNNAHSHGSYSDIRLKSNLTQVDNAINNVLKLKPYSYQYNDINSNLSNDKSFHYGFIAQEVETIYPDLVIEDNDGYKKIKYTEIIPLLVAAINDQNKTIFKLSQEVEKLKHDKE